MYFEALCTLLYFILILNLRRKFILLKLYKNQNYNYFDFKKVFYISNWCMLNNLYFMVFKKNGSMVSNNFFEKFTVYNLDSY